MTGVTRRLTLHNGTQATIVVQTPAIRRTR
jgi:hypothetical protein